MKITFFGLGEAGGLIATDLLQLARADIEIHGYDPASTATPEGLIRHDNPLEAVDEADLVFALTASADCKTALQQALESIPEHAVYADFASASPGLKRQLAATASNRRLLFCDVALLAMVPGNGLGTPSMVSGNGAERFRQVMGEFGMPVTQVSDVAGDAAERKLLRSVMMKGLAAVVIESMQGAQAAGCSDWLWQNICDEICKADHITMERLFLGSQQHAQRRHHEMQASQEMLLELGVEPVMTKSTVLSLQKILTDGIPDLPG